MTFATRLRSRAQPVQGGIDQTAIIKAAIQVPDRRVLIYKADDGAVRWLARASTSFEDKDGEIVSKAALTAAAQKIMESDNIPATDRRMFRWWHVGTKANEGAIDFGTVDLAFVFGETLFTGGTLNNPAYAALLKSDDEISIGFLPLDNNGDKTYDSIDIIEVSVCPRGTARNLFTGVAIA